MYILPLALLAVALSWPVPRLMAGFTSFRRAARAALVVWQSIAMAALLAALFTAPVAVPFIVRQQSRITEYLGLVALAGAISGLVLARLLVAAHRVGHNLRIHRKRHRELVDVLAAHGDPQLRVIEHPTPTAYCLPGLSRRVVLSQGTIDRLPADELEAVLAHERAHLAARHDLILEFFSVVYEAVPPFARSDAALREVHLLIEVLADRAAVREVGIVPTARAIVGMAGGPSPAGSIAMGGAASVARVRIGLLEPTRIWGLPVSAASALMYVFAAVLVAMPIMLLSMAFAGFLVT
ncbi:MAG: M56 family metallopeptidase [Intrasporangium sp.]|uniref:M56 family metallopeptidase n=1 Tax=Intrasporangium sp. TaxID=1925024 RepID=UPI002647D38C|nr:M56 family metallopeptidase [Intrasporangium sp.]MDN5794839.1 M56 family metallopeptidase [Intrasporangium sp.]